MYYLNCHVKLFIQLIKWFHVKQRLLMVSLLLSTNCQESSRQQADAFCWSNELYPGEFDDLTATNLISKESGQPISPGLQDPTFNTVITKTSGSLVSREVLQV